MVSGGNIMKKIIKGIAVTLLLLSVNVFADTLYTIDNVNFRSEPMIEDNVIRVITANTEVEVNTQENNNGYYKVVIDNEEGYIHSDYLIDISDFEYLGEYKITGYKMFSAAENGGRSDGVTASGVIGEPGKTVAMKDIDFGTRIYIKGLGVYVVEDRGVGSGVVDIACWTTDECYALTGNYDVYIERE